MDFRIEKTHRDEETIIQVSGELRGVGIVELERLCRETTGPLSLDLSNLHSLEAEGVKLIRELSSRGVVLAGASPYIQLLLG